MTAATRLEGSGGVEPESPPHPGTAVAASPASTTLPKHLRRRRSIGPIVNPTQLSVDAPSVTMT